MTRLPPASLGPTSLTLTRSTISARLRSKTGGWHQNRMVTPVSPWGAPSSTRLGASPPGDAGHSPDPSLGPTDPVSPTPTHRPSQTQCSTLITALDVYGFGQQYLNVPEYTGLSTAGPSTAPYPAQSTQPSPHPATFSDPTTTPSPVPTLSWGCKCPPYFDRDPTAHLPD